MAAWQNLIIAGTVVCSLLMGCKVTSGDDEIEDTSSTAGRKSTGVGGKTSGEGGATGDAGETGDAGATFTDYTEADCPAFAAAEPDASCTECIYENLCALAVPCLNTAGCMDSVIAATNCVWEAWDANDQETEALNDGFVTETDEEGCFVDNLVAENDGNELWIAIAGRDEAASTECAAYCYLDQVFHH